jgi:hypothetical protein
MMYGSARLLIISCILAAFWAASGPAWASSYSFSYTLRDNQSRIFRFMYPKKDGDLIAEVNQTQGRAVLCIKRCRVPSSPADCTCQDLSPGRGRLRCSLSPKAKDKGCNWGVRITCGSRECSGMAVIRLAAGSANLKRPPRIPTGLPAGKSSLSITRPPYKGKAAPPGPAKPQTAAKASVPAKGMIRSIPLAGGSPTKAAEVEYPSRIKAILEAGKSQWFGFRSTGGPIKISSSGGLKLKAELYGPGSKVIAQDQGGKDKSDIALSAGAGKGWHFLKISGTGPAIQGNYELKLGKGRLPVFVMQGREPD